MLFVVNICVYFGEAIFLKDTHKIAVNIVKSNQFEFV